MILEATSRQVVISETTHSESQLANPVFRDLGMRIAILLQHANTEITLHVENV